MSFPDSIQYLQDYRTARLEALRNLKPAKWFTAPAAGLTEMMQNFTAKDENSAWEEMQTGNIDVLKQQAVRVKIAFLASLRHDLRGQYAVTQDNDPKTGNDFDRHAYADTNGARYDTNYLALVVAGKAQGAVPPS